MLKVRSSRRAATLKPTDYDHEITLVDHDGLSASPANGYREETIDRISTESRLLPSVGEEENEHGEGEGEDRGQQSDRSRVDERDNDIRVQERPAEELQHEQELPHAALRPSIEVQGWSTSTV